MKKEKKNKLPFKQRMFNKVLEKPINDILFVTYELYRDSCRVYLDEESIPNFEDFGQIVNDKLKQLYNGGVESC